MALAEEEVPPAAASAARPAKRSAAAEAPAAAEHVPAAADAARPAKRAAAVAAEKRPKKKLSEELDAVDDEEEENSDEDEDYKMEKKKKKAKKMSTANQLMVCQGEDGFPAEEGNADKAVAVAASLRPNLVWVSVPPADLELETLRVVWRTLLFPVYNGKKLWPDTMSSPARKTKFQAAVLRAIKNDATLGKFFDEDRVGREVAEANKVFRPLF